MSSHVLPERRMLPRLLSRGRFVATSLAMALQALWRWPLRAALTSFGILVGVFAVTVTVALGEGARSKVSLQVDSLGSNLLLVQPERGEQSGAKSDQTMPKLTEADATAIKTEASGARYVAPILSSRDQVIGPVANTSVEIVGTNRDVLPVRAWGLQSGHMWSREAETTGERVCLIGQTVKDEVFGDQDPVGQIVRIGRHPFRVIGLLRVKGQDPFGRDEDARVLMPLKTARAKLRPTLFQRVDAILVSAESEESTESTQRAVEALLRERHGLAEGAESDFRVHTQQEFREAQSRIMRVLNVLLVSIAIVSLLVGGIGIMNIMLVSVSERTREIGIRLSVGARARDIMLQFLVESCVLSGLGGAMGAVAALVAVEFLARALSLPMAVSLPVLSVALVVSTAIGVVFGFFPARRAARLDPIVALSQD
jgi:putative ABC transport system permease protein